jgi:hypothetical protein
MTNISIHFTTRRGPAKILLLAVTIALMVSACGGAALPKATLSAPSRSAATSAPIAAVTSPANNPASQVDCAAIDKAYFDFAFTSQTLMLLKSDDMYATLKDSLATQAGPGSFLLANPADLRADLAVLATLPDTTNENGDKPSTMVAQVRQVLDLVDSNVQSGKPFSDGSGNGQKMLDLWTPLAMTQKASQAFADAFRLACPTYTPEPPASPTPPAFKLKSKAECDALTQSATDFSPSTLATQIISDDAYSIFQPGSPDYINLANLQTSLDALATLPDIADVTAQVHFKPSELIPQYQQLLDLIKSNVKSGSKPFSDGSGNGQKALDLATKLFGTEIVFELTIAQVCP